MNKLRFIKLLVFILTFMLISGIIFAGQTIYKKVQKNNLSSEINLNQAVDSRIKSFQIYDNKLYILLTNKHYPDSIIVLDSSSHKIISQIKTFKENSDE